MSGRPLPLLGSQGPWGSGPATPRATCVLAPNPGPMTLDGTNTWVLGEPGAPAVAVLDPGPDDSAHLAAIEAAAAARDARIAVVLLTHGHPDHAEGARSLAERTGAPVRALDPAHRLGSEGLADGDVVCVSGLELHVLATPGHTDDCLSFHLAADGALLTGDTVLGRGTSVVAWPEGQLAAYLSSLELLRRLAESSDAGLLLPGHGPVLDEPVRRLDDYLEHRRQRLAMVADAVADGARTPAEVVAAVYADVPTVLWPAAELAVRAQLDYLAVPT